MSEAARCVVIRKGVMEGLPCLKGTRIPSVSIKTVFLRGLRVAQIADMYGHPLVDVEAVEAALRYEMRRRRK